MKASKSRIEAMAWELHEQLLRKFPFILPFIEGVQKWVRLHWGKADLQDLNLIAEYLLANNLCDHD